MRVSKIDSMRCRRPEIWGAWPGSSLAVGADQGGAGVGDRLGELGAGVALGGDDRLAAAERSRQHGGRDLAFVAFGRPHGRRSGGAIGGGEQVQAHAEEVARVAGAVAAAGGIGDRVAERAVAGPLDGFA
jgi:hypothetical protein